MKRFLIVMLLFLLLCAGIAQASPAVTGHMELEYAQQFRVDYLDNGCALITIGETDQYLLVPEDMENVVMMDPGENVQILRQPLSSVYVASSSAMDLFLQAGALAQVKMTSTNEAGWTIPQIRTAVENGQIRYIGKYSAPDYEALLAGGCTLAVENTMIYHSPQIREELEQLGIPVLVERSSYEPHPLGRVEWIKLYGLLTGRLEEAEAFFREGEEQLGQMLQDTSSDGEAAMNSEVIADEVESMDSEAFSDFGETMKSGVPSIGNEISDEDPAREDSVRKKVIFFYITSSGYANVRKSGDYISKMIEMAGGAYLFSDTEQAEDDDNALSTMNMDLETFYEQARDADILIYNSTVDSELETVEELLEKSPLLADFKAVREGNAWCTNRNMFQQVSGTVQMILDLHTVIEGKDAPLTFLHKLRSAGADG